jgi:LCP family protein required for cell wall assembly
LLVGANIVVALCIVGAISAYGYVQWKLNQIHREQIGSLTSANGGKPFTILVVGSDTRSALADNTDNQQFGGSSSTPGQRSDTIILARVVPSSHQIMLLSIPRDLWVNIPGQGMNRINSAFDTNADLLVQTVQTDLGIPVNHFVAVDFDTFRQITDAVGGVSFYFPTPAKDAYSLLNVPNAGCVLLTGDQALGFVRSRHYEYYQNGEWHFEAESDLARIQRQQAFIKKMVKKAESKFTDIGAVNGIINGLTKNLTVDSGFSNSLLLDLARDFHGIDPAAITNLTLPNYSFTTAGGADVLGLQQPQAAQTIAAFNSFGNNPPPSARPKTKTPKPTVPPTVAAPRVTVAPSSVSVEVSNGDGVGGQAAALTGLLTGKGYRAVTNAASPGMTFAVTEVHYAPDAHTAAQQIGASIPGGAKLVKDPSLSPTPYNVEVISGSSYTTATGGTPVSSPSSSGPTTSTTTVPGTNTATYVLPGTPAGQTPPNC